MASAEKPSDRPSSWFGVRAGKSQQLEPQQMQTAPVPSPSSCLELGPWVSHLCSGPRRKGD
eukprot:9515615-Alexandrium_andersonii.AAC.1